MRASIFSRLMMGYVFGGVDERGESALKFRDLGTTSVIGVRALQLLDAAVQAPNHHRVRPWRFIVIRGAARERMGDIMAESLRQRKPETPEEGLAAERAKALRSPVIIAVGVDKPAEAKIDEIENICAAAAATQNLLLAAEGLGLAAMWRPGPAARNPAIKAFLDLQQDQHLISFVYRVIRKQNARCQNGLVLLTAPPGWSNPENMLKNRPAHKAGRF